MTSWLAELGRRMRVAAAVSLLAAVAALAAALNSAADARGAGRELSQRLVPAASAAGVLAAEYALERTSLWDYLVTGTRAARTGYQSATRQIPPMVGRLDALTAADAALRARLAAVRSAHQAWVSDVADPQLAALRAGDRAAVQRLQASALGVSRARAVQALVGGLQQQITAAQAVVTDRLRRAQRWLLFALLGTVVLIAAMATAGLVGMRRWLLGPFGVLRAATDAVAAGDHTVVVPVVGPAELADLGRSIEAMRTRLLTALADREEAWAQLRDVLEASPEATVQVAGDGSIVLVNGQAERLFRYPRDELVGAPVELLLPAAVRDVHAAHRAGYIADPRLRTMGEGRVLRAVDRDGREFPVEVSLGPVATTRGLIVSAAIRDISERLAVQAERERLVAEAEQERYERRLAQSQRLESLGQLVGGVAHDFNNLLNIILGYAGFVAEQLSQAADPAAGAAPDADGRFQHMLADVQQVRGAAERAARLTHQLLTFGRRDVTKPEVVSLNDIVGGLEHMLRRTLGEHIRLTVDLDPGLWPIKADPGQLEQVLVNLAVNARDAMPSGGELSIDTANIPVDGTYAAVLPGLKPGRYARLRITDTGTGMDRETLARVFEPFFTTKPKGRGTGLGLATVYGIVTQAGGHPELHSEPGTGTTFSALLPATQDAASSTEEIRAAPAPAHGETVLLVEDEASLRDMVGRLLSAHGYQVRVAATAAAALDETTDLDQPIDLLLTDVVMPTMLGCDLAARAHVVRPGLPVLYMSGYAHDMLNSQGTLDDTVDLLEKPFTGDHLLHRIHQALGRTPATAGPR